MKNVFLPITTFAFLASSLSAQDGPIPGSVANVTVALTLTSTIPGTVKKNPADGKAVKGTGAGPAYDNDWEINNTTKKTEERTYEYVSKMKTVKFGNKELLLELVDREIITKVGNAPYIAGWTIVVANATTMSERGADQQSSRIYAVRKTPELIIKDLSNFIDFDYNADYAESGTFKEVRKSTGVGTANETSSTTTTSAFNWKETNSYYIDFDGFESGPIVTALEGGFEFQGISTLGNKLTTVGAEKVPVIVDSAGKLSAISGAGPYLDEFEAPDEGEEEEENEGERSVVEGSISFAAGKAEADVSGYENIDLGESEW